MKKILFTLMLAACGSPNDPPPAPDAHVVERPDAHVTPPTPDAAPQPYDYTCTCQATCNGQTQTASETDCFASYQDVNTYQVDLTTACNDQLQQNGCSTFDCVCACPDMGGPCSDPVQP